MSNRWRVLSNLSCAAAQFCYTQDSVSRHLKPSLFSRFIGFFSEETTWISPRESPWLDEFEVPIGRHSSAELAVRRRWFVDSDTSILADQCHAVCLLISIDYFWHSFFYYVQFSSPEVSLQEQLSHMSSVHGRAMQLRAWHVFYSSSPILLNHVPSSFLICSWWSVLLVACCN
jgi:hypothetical protein